MKQRRPLYTVLSLFLALVLAGSLFTNMLPVTARAESSSEIREEIKEVEEERKEIQKQLSDLKADMNANMAEIEKIAAEKSVIDQEIGLLNQEIQLINDQILAYGMLIADKQDELDQAQAELDALSQKNKERVRTMEEEGTLSYWSVLFRANSFADLLDRLNMIEEIAAADRRRLEDMRVAREAVKLAQDELAVEKKNMEDVRKELEVKDAELADKRAEASKKLVELNARNDEFLEMLEAAEEADNELVAEIAKLEKEYSAAKDREEAASRPPVSSGTGTTKPPASVTNGITWVMPCSYVRLSSPYGWRIHPVYGYPKFHAGVDLANSQGTPIYATRSGTVTIATYSSSAGYYVSINHGDGFSSQYMHMTHYIVSVGQTVKAGQVIGYMGSTGVSTGSHLHFAICYNGGTQNPADYLNFK